MNLLLVDDEFDVLNGILNAVNFDVIGVDTVYTSQDAGHAKELLSRCEVDVMVTDIEMPGESGLELMQWVRERRLEIVMLFCTVYADFNYAQKAVELHSFDYFLKPIYYPALQERIGAAVQEAQRLKSERNYRKFGQRWVQSCGEAARNFWNAAV
ncbi:MAG: response regulator, partial [Oscillospiraceae bacterium]|nr:response regulator [Oscillospiraceae bacterium]